MNPAIEKLTKFLQLEAERDFDNRAVMGGLDCMLEPWQIEAREHHVPEDLINVVTSRLRDYPKLSPNSRKEALQGILNRIRSMDDSITPKETERPKIPAASAQQTTPERSARKESRPVPSGGTRAPRVQSHQQESAAKSPPTGKRPRQVITQPVAMKAPLTTLQGVGPKIAQTLNKLKLFSLGDLLWHLPRRYDDYSRLKPISRLWYGEDVTVIAMIENIQLRNVRKGSQKLVEARVSDGSGTLRISWFNQAWLARRLSAGKSIVLSGKIDQYLGHLVMNNPEWELVEQQNLHTNRIIPVYPLTAGISNKWLRRIIHTVVDRMTSRIPDPLPDSVLAAADLMMLGNALQQIHFPDSQLALAQAQHRLAFDEMLYLQMGVLRQKHDWEKLETAPIPCSEDWLQTFLSRLPYKLTEAQQKAITDISADLASSRPMNRLLQGDVGSGKTIVAAAALGITAASGAQAALMAPTSILAEQHYRTLTGLLPEAAGIEAGQIRLLLGGTSAAERSEIDTGLQDGSIRIVIGTHALIEGPVQFKDLKLAIIDEQHRFGVQQRALLRSKGDNPNLLVMTATPIPRSLSLTVFGDLDLSVIDEMPPGRQPIETRVLFPAERMRAYTFLNAQIKKGHQAYIIYPLVEESEKIEAPAAVEEHARLQAEIFPEYQIGLLHGRMRPDQKDEVMQRFNRGEDQILVSTSVVEVGVDVPNATVMMIEGANRFGLAQLHQFRGRVGRGEVESFCLLLPESADDIGNERLKSMEATNDGFRLAELDLQQRGPGDFLGTRQSGYADLHLADITDLKMIEKARREARRLFEEDPDLSQPEHELLRQALADFWKAGSGDIS